MNDDKNSKAGKVKVMYVRPSEGDKPRAAKGNPRTGKGMSRDHWATENKKAAAEQQHPSTSPWKTVSRRPQTESSENAATSQAKLPIDPALIRQQRKEETRVYGENACQALFMSRSESIVRAWFVQSVTLRFRETLRWLAANRKAYHVVPEEEIAKAAGTEHHGGVCFIIKKQQGLPVEQWLETERRQDCVVALERVSNPHNLGAIMRSCAHFGVEALLVDDASLVESGAAVRTAEGGAEHVRAITSETFHQGIERFREAGYTIVTTSSHQGTALSAAKLPAKCVIVLGQEGEGLQAETLKKGDLNVVIAGTNNIESLNVSVAAGILLAEWWRQQH